MSWQKVSSAILTRMFQGAFAAREAEARWQRQALRRRGERTPQERLERETEAELAEGRRAARAEPGRRRRNVLFITVDQQRHDALGVSGGTIARTPALDALAGSGIRYTRAMVHNVVCMPSRSTMLTGQHPRTHGVVANGIPLPEDAPSVARYLRRAAGYRTALLGKAHFEPHLDPTLAFAENALAARGSTGPWRGFEHVELSTHGPLTGQHYARWLWQHHPDAVAGFAGVLTGAGGGDTGAPEVAHNPVPREAYHTDWIADRALAWLRAVPDDEPWFCWVSFPDPHHPFDPPLDEVRRRLDWRDLPLPAGRPASPDRIRAALKQKPRHWLDWYEGRYRNPEGGPVAFSPGALTDDQLREMLGMIHVENELIDDACARLFAWLRESGRDADTDIVYTSDHGELQGDHGLFFKGPYAVDALMRIPLLWRPAPSAAITPAPSAARAPDTTGQGAVVEVPVGHQDLAPTFCAAAGVAVPEWMDGAPLPTGPDPTRVQVVSTFDSQFSAVGMHTRTLYRDGFNCTRYLPSGPEGGGAFPVYWAIWGTGSTVPRYDGTEGELYDHSLDPHQWENRWSDPAYRTRRDALLAELDAALPPLRVRLPVATPT